MRRFSLNGKTYIASPMNFNTICDLEDLGVSLDDFFKKRTLFMRAYVALSMGGDARLAGEEIEAHIIGGGTLDALTDIMRAEIDESDFFQTLTQRQTERAAADEAETSKEEAPIEKQSKKKA